MQLEKLSTVKLSFFQLLGALFALDSLFYDSLKMYFEALFQLSTGFIQYLVLL
jgi:hypothetical protein